MILLLMTASIVGASTWFDGELPTLLGRTVAGTPDNEIER